jgi:Zn-dependent protease/CBS domain-containing protein
MQRGFRIGRIFGIQIGIDWSWIFIFLLITWALGTGLRASHPAWSVVVSWGVALVSSLLFFASVLAHELAHSLYARSRGVPVKSITLFLFGGVSNIEHEPDSPRSEFVMAILGPVTSLALGGILLLLTGLIAGPLGRVASPAEAAARLGPVPTIFFWLGSINVILGIFNLVPGFPLDGGRVLRSLLWAITRDFRRATRYATFAGQGVAWLLIVMGIAMVFGARMPFFGSGLGGLWLAFIGWFLHSAATQSYQQVVVRDILGGVPVSAIAFRNPPTVSPDSTVEALVHDHIMQSDDHAFPVMEGDSLVGLVTLGDVRSTGRDQWQTRRVRDVMTPRDRLVAVAPGDDAAGALAELARRNVRQLPVIDRDRLVGLLRRRDIVRWLQLHADLHGGGANSGS